MQKMNMMMMICIKNIVNIKIINTVIILMKIIGILVIGGGATGAGIALDAITRGLSVGLVECNDFSSGASSRSTKVYIYYLQNTHILLHIYNINS